MSLKPIFTPNVAAGKSPAPIDIDDLVGQIPLELRGSASKHWRPGDVRIAMLTEDLGGAVHSFPNIGSPDNKPSEVAFDGRNCIQVMLKGSTPQQELMSARAVIDEMTKRGVLRVTPEFIEDYMTLRGQDHPFIRQNYGPAPYEDMARLFVDTPIVDPNTGIENTINPQQGEGYTFGFRAPVQEEAYLIMCVGAPGEVFVKGGKSAESVLTGFESAMKRYARGSNTAAEQFIGFGHLAKGIVISSRDGDTWKPIDLNVAPEIYQLNQLSVVMIGSQGKLMGVYRNVSEGAPGAERDDGWSDPVI